MATEERPELHAEIVEMEAERLPDDSPRVVKPNENKLGSKPPPLPAQGPSSTPSLAPRASSIPPIPTRAPSSVSPLPAHLTSSLPPANVAIRPATPAVPPGADELRALLRAAKGVLGELDQMIQEMERRLSDPATTTNWWESEKHRRWATFGVSFSLAIGLAGLVMALFGSR